MSRAFFVPFDTADSPRFEDERMMGPRPSQRQTFSWSCHFPHLSCLDQASSDSPHGSRVTRRRLCHAAARLAEFARRPKCSRCTRPPPRVRWVHSLPPYWHVSSRPHPSHVQAQRVPSALRRRKLPCAWAAVNQRTSNDPHPRFVCSPGNTI